VHLPLADRLGHHSIEHLSQCQQPAVLALFSTRVAEMAVKQHTLKVSHAVDCLHFSEVFVVKVLEACYPCCELIQVHFGASGDWLASAHFAEGVLTEVDFGELSYLRGVGLECDVLLEEDAELKKGLDGLFGSFEVIDLTAANLE